MSSSRIMKWITGGLEALLGIPILGGAFILSMVWVPLGVMLVLHIFTLILSKQQKESGSGSILGIVASTLGIIPGLGMILHILSAIFLIISASKGEEATE